jgi:hypothetical protein
MAQGVVGEIDEEPAGIVTIVGMDATSSHIPTEQARTILGRHHAGPVIRNGAYWNGTSLKDHDKFLLIKGWREGGTRVLTNSGITYGELLAQSRNWRLEDDITVELWDEENFCLILRPAELHNIAERYQDRQIERNGIPWDGSTVEQSDSFRVWMGKPDEEVLFVPVEIWTEDDNIIQTVLDDAESFLRTHHRVMRNGNLWDRRTIKAGDRFRIIDISKELQFYWMLAIVKTHQDAVTPFRTHAQDVGLDIHLLEAKEKEHGVWWFRTGWAMSPPPGYFLLLAERSSTHLYGWSLADKVGIIDPNYRGEIFVVMRKLWINR